MRLLLYINDFIYILAEITRRLVELCHDTSDNYKYLVLSKEMTYCDLGIDRMQYKKV